MTSRDFRRMALALPEVVENSHMGHPDFRVNGKVFATLQYPDKNWGMVKLPPEQQNEFVQNHSRAFTPVKGAWGRQGCTSVLLQAVDEGTLKEALQIAWNKAAHAPKKNQTNRKPNSTTPKASAKSRPRAR